MRLARLWKLRAPAPAPAPVSGGAAAANGQSGTANGTTPSTHA